jgi:hypothetical protein
MNLLLCTLLNHDLKDDHTIPALSWELKQTIFKRVQSQFLNLPFPNHASIEFLSPRSPTVIKNKKAQSQCRHYYNIISCRLINQYYPL